MFPRFFSILSSFILLFFVGCKNTSDIRNKSLAKNEVYQGDSKKLNSFSQLETAFKDPPPDYRGAPLWDWNDSISKKGIKYQMKEFKKAGIGGVFVHPRPGLITEYLSDKWFELFDFVVKQGKKLDINVWIYDENSYPSGFAGGHVPAEMPSSYEEGTGLKMTKQNELDVKISDTLEVVLEETDKGLKEITNNLHSKMGERGTFYIFKKTFPPRSLWFGGYSYVDLFHEDVTDKFLDITMREGYAKENKNDFGKRLKGGFSDEPNAEEALDEGSDLRWTPDLWDAFLKRWGYDLRPKLPMLVEEIGDWKKVRHDFYSTLLSLFIDRWAKPMSKYYSENDLIWTGHYWEHGWPIPTTGFDESIVYTWLGMPGIDMLGNELEGTGQGPQFGNTRAVRELRSVANQMGQKRTLSETFGGGGWDVDFKTFKRLVDWEVVLGVNFVNQHLSYYSIKGARKFDYPPSFSYHEPWWENYSYLADYIGRISLAMSAGDQVNSTLVLQPNSTAWMYFSRENKRSELDSIQYNFKDFIYRLERRHLEYDLGSENVLKKYGKVDAKKLVVGERGYDLIVIPKSMENIDKGTYKLIKKYLEEGGKVLSFRDKIDRIDGEKNPDVYRLQQDYSKQWNIVDSIEESLLNNLLDKNKFIEEKDQSGELYFQKRNLEDGKLLFLVNSDNHEESCATISLEGEDLVKMNLENGDINRIPFGKKNGKITFDVHLDSIGSALYFVSNKTLNGFKKKERRENWEFVKPEGGMKTSPNSKNTLVLDYLDLETSDSTMRDTYFMKALSFLYKDNGVGFGDPWQHKIQYKKDYVKLDTFSDNSAFNVKYHFKINNKSNLSKFDNTHLIVEYPELWDVFINGHLVKPESNKFWIDRDFPVFKINNYLRHGENTISLRADRMSVFAELMPVYVRGDFKVGDSLKLKNGKLDSLGSWKDLGYKFYSDKVSYSRKYEIDKDAVSAFRVKLNSWNGTVAEVLVNGKQAGSIAWPPYELDITDFMKNGKNEITIKVIGSLKNVFGPFYEEDRKAIYGPFDWENAPKVTPNWNKYYQENYGLFEPFDLEIESE